jgi:hypothetical protein
MARSFNGTSQYAQYAGAVVTGYPFTLAAWVKPGVNGLENDFVLSLSDVSENAVYQAIVLGGGTVGDEGKVLAVSRNTTLAAAKTSAAMSADTWNHAAGVFSSATSRAAYLNGGNKGTETTNITFAAGIDTTAIGRLSRPTPAAYFHGSCAEAGVWAAALSDEEIAALAAGLSPLQVRPQSLVAYWPLFARATNEEDWVGGNTLTVTGATAADHPRIIYPAWPEIILSAAAAADSSGAGSSSGSSTVAGAGASINAQAGSSAGSASVSGVGASTNAQAGSSSGTATVSGVGASIHEAAGASAGTATVSGVGDSTSAGSAAGSSAGTATVSGVGASVHTAVGTAAGSSTAVGVSSAIERMTSGGLSRSRNRNRKRYLINGRVYSLTQPELVELLAQRGGDVKPETIKVERSQKPRLIRNRMTAQPTGSVDRRRASIEITLNPMETQFKPLTKADYMALAEAVEMLIDEQDMMDLLAYL